MAHIVTTHMAMAHIIVAHIVAQVVIVFTFMTHIAMVCIIITIQGVSHHGQFLRGSTRLNSPSAVLPSVTRRT